MKGIKILKGVWAVLLSFFLAACANSKVKENEPPAKTDDTSEYVGREAYSYVNNEQREYFFLVAEGRYLNLYNMGTEKSLRTSERIDLSVFPESDAGTLQKGIKFDTIDEAYSVMESFIN